MHTPSEILGHGKRVRVFLSCFYLRVLVWSANEAKSTKGRGGETRGLLTMGWDKPCFLAKGNGGSREFLGVFFMVGFAFLLPDIFFGGETSLDNFFITCLISFVIFLKRIFKNYCNLQLDNHLSRFFRGCLFQYQKAPKQQLILLITARLRPSALVFFYPAFCLAPVGSAFGDGL